MLKTTMDKKKVKASPSLDGSTVLPSGAAFQGTGEKTNPFRFIEAALTEAKSKIEKMKTTPQILDAMPDD